MVKPLIRAAKAHSQELRVLAVSALVNLCNHSDDIKEMFYQKNGHILLVEMLTSTKDSLYIVSLLKLILSFTKDSEKFSKAVSQLNQHALVKHFLLPVFDGTGFTSIEFP